MGDGAAPVRVAAMYQFTRFHDPDAVRRDLLALCDRLGVRGTLLIGTEGLNGTIAGDDASVDAVLAHIRALPGCATMDVRLSRAATPPFARLKVRRKREIVTMGVPAIDPLSDAGDYVEPAAWNALIDDPHVLVIDTRNDHEVALGSFPGAINPRTRRFSDFPAWFRAFRAARAGPMPPIAMFCTGGIRCEKASAFLKAEGVDRVFHLRGGILAYLETVREEDSRWEGDCFVFDERVSVTARLEPGGRVLCRSCQRQLGPGGCAACEAR